MDISVLYDSWLDKISWLAVLGFSGLIISMLSTHAVETKGQYVDHSPQARLALEYKPKRSVETRRAIKQCEILYKEKRTGDLIVAAQKMLTANPQEPFGFMYLGRAYSLKSDYPQTLSNYRKAVELNPDFVDKNSPDRIGKKYLMPLVREVIVKSRTPAFKKIANYRATMKNLYYLQRRMAGGCE